VDKLKPGMDKNQVRFIMGTPVIVDPFHSDRWDYVYTFTEGGHQRQQRHLALYFKNDKLALVKGDVVAGVHKAPADTVARSTTVEVPDSSKKENFLARFFEWNEVPEETTNKKSEGEGDGRGGHH
jgi:outer membrane protein assembly factor BamE